MRLMEIDEKWQTGRRYIKITEGGKYSNQNKVLLKEIKQMKKGVKTQEKLVLI